MKIVFQINFSPTHALHFTKRSNNNKFCFWMDSNWELKRDRWIWIEVSFGLLFVYLDIMRE